MAMMAKCFNAAFHLRTQEELHTADEASRKHEICDQRQEGYCDDWTRDTKLYGDHDDTGSYFSTWTHAEAECQARREWCLLGVPDDDKHLAADHEDSDRHNVQYNQTN